MNQRSRLEGNGVGVGVGRSGGSDKRGGGATSCRDLSGNTSGQAHSPQTMFT